MVENVIAPVAVVVCITVAGVVYLWARMRVTRSENALKAKMVDKGMSPAEMREVMLVSSTRGGTWGGSGATTTKAGLIHVLLARGFKAESIERILLALAKYPGQELIDSIFAVQIMVGKGMETEDIERVMLAFGVSEGRPGGAPVHQ